MCTNLGFVMRFRGKTLVEEIESTIILLGFLCMDKSQRQVMENVMWRIERPEASGPLFPLFMKVKCFIPGLENTSVQSLSWEQTKLTAGWQVVYNDTKTCH